jgi:hypothetical protein
MLIITAAGANRPVFSSSIGQVVPVFLAKKSYDRFYQSNYPDDFSAHILKVISKMARIYTGAVCKAKVGRDEKASTGTAV